MLSASSTSGDGGCRSSTPKSRSAIARYTKLTQQKRRRSKASFLFAEWISSSERVNTTQCDWPSLCYGRNESKLTRHGGC